MSKPVIVSHFYDAKPDAVWHVATDFACFAEAMKGVATFEGMPTEGKLQPGDVFNVKVRLFGWMPPMDYHMELAEYDPDEHMFRSVESGGSIRRWEHVLTVAPEGGGARLTDHITIDAGLATPMMRLWARFVYNRRHAPRARILARMNAVGSMPPEAV